MRVDPDLTALGLHPQSLEPQAFGKRAPADGDEDNVDFDCLGVAAR
jgi:hypothetical protein